MSRRMLALWGMVLLAGFAAPVVAQDLPDYTPDQRWARAEFLTNAYIVLAIRYGRLMDQSVDDVAQATFEIYSPAWTAEMGPQDLLAGLHTNWMWQRNAQFEVLESTPTKARARGNRAYLSFFGDTHARYGVTVEEYERMLAVFYQGIAASRGMAYEQRVDGDWIYFTLTTR